MGRYKAALFDLDGTLIDRVAAVGRVAEALYQEEPSIQTALAQSKFVELFVGWDDDGYISSEDLYTLVQKTWPEVTRLLAELLDWHYRMMSAAVQPDERIVAFLRNLNNANVPWGIITNGGPAQRPKIAAGGFDDLMKFVIVSGEVGYAKPDPRIYQDGLKQLGEVPAVDTLFVGDNIETDIGGAQSAGMATAWVKRGREWPSANQPPDYQVDHVDELRAVLL
jgi:putative hydrolase of the HAD superfamily